MTPEGLLGLHQACPTLRRLKFWFGGRLVGQVECGPGVDERHLLHSLRDRMREMVDNTRRYAERWMAR